MVIHGMPVVFDSPTVIHTPAGDYVEIIERGALDGCDLGDTRLLWGHDNAPALARTPKTMQLEVTPKGLAMTASLPDTVQARAVYEAVKRGDVTGMSVGFVVPKGGDSYDAKTNTRTIKRISALLECSIVNFPAYEGTTVSVEARDAITAEQDRYKAKQEALILANKIIIGGI